MGELHRSLRSGLLLGLAVGLLGVALSVSSFGHWLEEGLGLGWLFGLRGPVAAPPTVAVVTIDRESSDYFKVPNRPDRWPRELHARLVDRLAEAGAAVVAFDVHFAQPRDPDTDRQLADALVRAGNVVLFQRVIKETQSVDHDAGGTLGAMVVERSIPPIPMLAESAAALAPFTLPKVPVRVSQAWLFKPEVGGAPTLPAVALGIFCGKAQERLEMQVGVAELPPAATPERRIRNLRQAALGDDALVKRMRALLSEPGLDPLEAALVDLYTGPHSRYLNFYGPPRSIETFPYYKVVEGDPEALKRLHGRAVFVGFSEDRQPEQKDGFYTVYSQPDTGLDVSGVEIAATTFANLLERRPLTALSGTQLTLGILLWGLAIGVLLRRRKATWIVALAAGAGVVYLVAADWAFTSQALWLPLAIPLLVQLPVAGVGALSWGLHDAHRERQRIRQIFGYHLPPKVVDELARGMDLSGSGEQLFGICLSSDAESYTALSERLPPAELHALMNDYYQALFGPVTRSGGTVTDVVGDAMVAVWTAREPEARLRRTACEVAVEVLAAADRFNAERGGLLPTRLGLHCGELVVGHVGALEHFEYRAVGDIVNSANRLEGLSKRLGVRAVASEDLLEGLEKDIPYRSLGRFRLPGKTRALSVHELLTAEQVEKNAGAYARFEEGLAALQAGDWGLAQTCFDETDRMLGGDRPSRFYLVFCMGRGGEPPDDWDGVVVVEGK